MHTTPMKTIRLHGNRVKLRQLHPLISTAVALVFMLLVALSASQVMAQTVLSVPFTNGFVGKDDGSPNTAVQTYSFAGVPGLPAGGIKTAYFSQDVSSGTTTFSSCNGSDFLVGGTLDLCAGGKAQGNDVPGFVNRAGFAGGSNS